jgi:hypothetical protein
MTGALSQDSLPIALDMLQALSGRHFPPEYVAQHVDGLLTALVGWYGMPVSPFKCAIRREDDG